MHEEMFNILCHKGNANQNIIETPSHSSKNGYHQESKQLKMLARMWGCGKGTLINCGKKISVGTMEISMEVPHKTKQNYHIILLYHSWTYIQKNVSLHTTNTYRPMFTATLFTIAKAWDHTRFPSTDEWIKKMWYLYTLFSHKEK
jgi:hypothetical protein